VKTSSPEGDHFVYEDLKTHVYGDSAIVTGMYHETGTLKGKPISRRGRFTDSWVKRRQILAVRGQNTLISHTQQ
jgi:ketosteroid isomerase-like protein